MKRVYTKLVLIFLMLGLTACPYWPESARPHFTPDYAGLGGPNLNMSYGIYRPYPGTFDSRMPVKIYDAARKVAK